MDFLIIGLIAILVIQMLYLFLNDTNIVKPILQSIPTPPLNTIVGGAKKITKQMTQSTVKAAGQSIVTSTLKTAANPNLLKNILECKNLISDLL